MIRIDLNKALEIHQNKIRSKREELFKTLDIQFMRALEAGNSVLAAEIGTKKQALRDATNIDISKHTQSNNICVSFLIVLNI